MEQITLQQLEETVEARLAKGPLSCMEYEVAFNNLGQIGLRGGVEDLERLGVLMSDLTKAHLQNCPQQRQVAL